ncbi:MAG: tetratricopeptide repeat protein [Bacteroidetes bacterium]|nr:tetratricopeptide repeat protein [Bacteroidota bacterium]
MSQDNSNNSLQSRIEKLNAMLVLQPEDCFLLHAKGLELLKLNKTLEALQSFQEVIRVNELYVGTYYHLARCFELLQRFDEAIETYKKGILVATKVKDMHARNELLMALEEIE